MIFLFFFILVYYGSHTPLFSAAVSRIKKFIMMSLGFACFFWPEYHNNRNILHNAKTSRWIWLLLLNNKQSPQTNIIWYCKQFQYVYYMVRTLDHFGYCAYHIKHNNYIVIKVNLDFVAASQTKSKSKNNLALEPILGCLFHTEYKNAQENPIFFFTWTPQNKNFRIIC